MTPQEKSRWFRVGMGAGHLTCASCVYALPGPEWPLLFLLAGVFWFLVAALR